MVHSLNWIFSKSRHVLLISGRSCVMKRHALWMAAKLAWGPMSDLVVRGNSDHLEASKGRGAIAAQTALGLAGYFALLGIFYWKISPLFPESIALDFLGHHLAIGNLHHRLFDNLWTVAIILPTAFAIETVCVGWAESSLREILVGPSASVKTDLAIFILDQTHLLSIISRVMMFGASMVTWMWLRQAIADETGLSVDPAGLPFVVQVVMFFVISSFFDYWTHRASHTELLWPLHRFHHSAEDFCIITSGRQHPANFVPIIMMNMPMALLGAPVEVMLYVNAMTLMFGLLIHSKLQSDWGWVGKYVVQSPVHHRMHHKLDMSHPTIHFGTMPVWDRLFGTWGEYANPKEQIGVDTPYRHGFWIWRDVLRDYLDLLTGPFKILARLSKTSTAKAPSTIQPT